MKSSYLAIVLAALCLLGGFLESDAQNGKGRAMRYMLIDGDTVYVDNIGPSYSFAGWKKRDMKKYFRLVRNFSKVYPFALVARRVVAKADSTFAKDKLGRSKRQKYVNDVQQKIMDAYWDTAKHMTISQGQLLIRLIDREVGISSYDIIKNYKNKMAAGFWQGVAKVFGSNMKSHYDPQGEDKDTEELIRKWERGEFPSLYFSIFGEYPTFPEPPKNLI